MQSVPTYSLIPWMNVPTAYMVWSKPNNWCRCLKSLLEFGVYLACNWASSADSSKRNIILCGIPKLPYKLNQYSVSEADWKIHFKTTLLSQTKNADRCKDITPFPLHTYCHRQQMKATSFLLPPLSKNIK